MGKSKFYVVWSGKKPGVYHSWADCEAQIKGVKGARYKSFSSKEEAQEMYEQGPDVPALPKQNNAIQNSIAVDAACSGNPGVVEYRGVYTATGTEMFRKKPIPMGTNNLGEFLAIIHALALLKKEGSTIPIYSDSETAMAWVRNGKVKSKLEETDETKDMWTLIRRGEAWLKDNTYPNQLLKWDTQNWGEIPADFGRK